MKRKKKTIKMIGNGLGEYGKRLFIEAMREVYGYGQTNKAGRRFITKEDQS